MTKHAGTTVLSPRERTIGRIPLDNLRDVQKEAARIYRLAVEKRIPKDDAVAFSNMLRRLAMFFSEERRLEMEQQRIDLLKKDGGLVGFGAFVIKPPGEDRMREIGNGSMKVIPPKGD